jgi:hypothetical protein
MSVCNPTSDSATLDECGNPVVATTPLTQAEQSRMQPHLNRAHTNKFLMIVEIPPAIRTKSKLTMRECDVVDTTKLQYSVFGTTVPTISLPAITVPYSGQELKVSSHSRRLEPMSLNYFVDNTFDNYWLLWRWADFIAGALNGFAGRDSSASYTELVRKHYNVLLKDYSTTISVYGLDDYNKPKVEWIYKGCMLTSLGGVQYNYQSTNEIVSSFTFDYTFLDCRLQ